MNTESAGNPGILAADWVRATVIGWFLGLLLMLALLFVGEAVGAAMSMVGIGMGAGVGYWQSRSLHGVLDRPWRWALVTVVGLGAPFVLWDVSAALGDDALLSVPACVAGGGLLVALGQWTLLRPLSARATRWVPACVIGWSLPAAAMALGAQEAVPYPWNEILGLVAMFLGGIMLGGVTGRPLALIFSPSAA